MSDPSLIVITVESDQEDCLKLQWSYGETVFLPYSADKNMLERKSEQVREQLEELVLHVINNGASACGNYLKQLAIAGADFYNALFYSVRGSGDPNEIKTWLENLNKPHRIVFSVKPRVHLPWGLIYSGNPAQLPDDPSHFEWSLYQDFWCHKYWLSTLYITIKPTAVSTARSANHVEIVGVVNRQAHANAFQSLDADEQQILTAAQDCWSDTIFSSQDLFGKWHNISRANSLLYFYCHANQTNLALSATDEITIDDLRLKLRKPLKECRDTFSLVVLNGCATATGAPGGGFLEATANPPFCGFVGTETSVPDLFAMKFGCELLRQLFSSGEPIFRVMKSLRERHWPLSIIYSLYCYSLLRIEPSESHTALGVISKKNFSLTPVGSTRLK